MKLGIIVPQGWTGDYAGWEPARAWARTIAVAQQADRLGAESIWLYDHFHTVPRPTDELTFESFTSLSALAALTERVAPRAHRRLQRIPQPSAHRQDGLDPRYHQRRSLRARHRRRLEA